MELLIVEDDDAMASALTAAVATAGHHPTRVARGADALLVHRKFEVILLDLGLPDMDGLEVLRKLRQVTPVPILILTARDDERSVVLGLRSGADDYLVKPVKLVELLARIEAVTRRAGRHGASRPQSVVLGDLEIDLERRGIINGGRLRPAQARILLQILLSNGNWSGSFKQAMDG